jgi:hypothetical protein
VSAVEDTERIETDFQDILPAYVDKKKRAITQKQFGAVQAIEYFNVILQMISTSLPLD